MTHENLPLLWIGIGVFLMALELLLPGLVVIFLGAAAVIVGMLIYLGLLTDTMNSIGAWFGLSLVLVLVFRRIALKFFPSESSYQLIEEDVDAVGKIVTVSHQVQENTNEGRIEYNGTSWPAISRNGTIEKGKKARLLYRDNISWVIEGAEKDE